MLTVIIVLFSLAAIFLPPLLVLLHPPTAGGLKTVEFIEIKKQFFIN